MSIFKKDLVNRWVILQNHPHRHEKFFSENDAAFERIQYNFPKPKSIYIYLCFYINSIFHRSCAGFVVYILMIYQCLRYVKFLLYRSSSTLYFSPKTDRNEEIRRNAKQFMKVARPALASDVTTHSTWV